MKLLLDTHVFLWYIAGERRIDEHTLSLIRDMQNLVYLSVISEWEMIIKHRLGRLPLPESPGQYIPNQRQRHLIETLPLEEAAVAVLTDLPAIHKDPFDRMLVAQAIHYGMILVTADAFMKQYARLSELDLLSIG